MDLTRLLLRDPKHSRLVCPLQFGLALGISAYPGFLEKYCELHPTRTLRRTGQKISHLSEACCNRESLSYCQSIAWILLSTARSIG